MEEILLQVAVNVLLKDGRAEFSIIRNKEDLDLQKMREILMGGLSLLIKGEDSNEKQAQAIRDVVQRLQEEFVDGDSFDNVWKKEQSSQSKYLYIMKYIITESQYNRLLSEDETKARQYVRRRLPDIQELIDKHMEEDDPNDWDDEFEYASNIINMTISDLSDFDYDTMDEDDVIDVIKEYFAETILDHYYDNVSPDDDEDEDF